MTPASEPPRVLVLHGPNLNLLGQREPDIYGSRTLGSIDDELRDLGTSLGLFVECRQSNHEGVLIDAVHEAGASAAALIINAGGYSHTSVALRDAVSAVQPGLVVLEVHLSNLARRESFRQQSLLSPVVEGRIEGLGPLSYLLALRATSTLLRARGVVL